MDSRKYGKYAVNIFSWLVKGVGAAVLLLVLAIFIGEGSPNPFKLTGRELGFMLIFLITITGLALALWRQLMGGIVILAGIACITIIFGIQNSWVFHAFWLIGVLNIICGWLGRKVKWTWQK